MPPLSLISAAPAVAVKVPPVQVVEALGVAATTIPEGRLSVNASPGMVIVPAVLSIVKVSVVGAFE